MTKTTSEIAIVDENILANHASRDMPNIASINVSKSTKVHIGPKIVAVNQTIENKELIKGHIFGLELVSAKSARRLRCSVAVFLCWAFLVAIGLVVYLVSLALHKQPVRLDIGLNASWYLRRSEWQAIRNYKEDFLNLPLQYVIVGHTASVNCTEKYECIKTTMNIQNDNLKRGYDDIVPNFLIGGKGFVFEGRGANIVAAMAKFYNTKSITIMFIGDFRYTMTNPEQIEHLEVLLETLVAKYVVRPDYIVYGHCQVSPDTISPGPNVLQSLRNLSHWNSTNVNRCIS